MECKVPGPAGTPWEKGLFDVKLIFQEGYPTDPPLAKFSEGFFHPNVYPDGRVCLSILNADKHWRPTMSVKLILLGVQYLLDHPNQDSPAQQHAFVLLTENLEEYRRRLQIQTARNVQERLGGH